MSLFYVYIQCFIIYDNAAKVVAWYHAGIVKPNVYCVKLKLCHSHQIKKKKPWLQKLNSTENAFTPTSVLNTFQENPHLVRSSGLNPDRHHHGHHRQYRHRHHKGHRRHGSHYEEQLTERSEENFFLKLGKVPLI